MQNGLLIKHAVQTPFLIDPNSTATEWLKKHLAATSNQSVDVIMQQDPRLVRLID